VEVYEIEGPFFFGVAGKFDEVMKTIGDKPRVRIIRMRKVPFVDSTGAHNLEGLVRRSQREGITILLSGVRDDVRQTLHKTGIEQLVGAENVLPHIDAAVARAKALLD
jgi:SulP family sulfate permease